ncbi:hypothetical protein I4F81_008340 [Pyropia yezoensis]|uniref:Uncharacterized protein n=1 Tax=Pyropia yezoensis TaxID=2788 RepID=A0ACC3C6M2_PYRYE|nr:hypothetical protein I4F81_008340 [Neopyropia yezoensis]
MTAAASLAGAPPDAVAAAATTWTPPRGEDWPSLTASRYRFGMLQLDTDVPSLRPPTPPSSMADPPPTPPFPAAAATAAVQQPPSSRHRPSAADQDQGEESPYSCSL